MRSDRLTGIVADLVGGAVRFDHSKLNFKPAEGKAKIAWHQDWAFYPHSNDDLLAVVVMLEDCTEENGPLMVIPGSYREPGITIRAACSAAAFRTRHWRTAWER